MQFPRVHEVLGRATNKASAKVGLEGIQVDVRALPAESYGAAMQYFTGSKDHNVALRHRASNGADAQRVRPVSARRRRGVAGATEEEVTRRSACRGFRRSCARTAARSRRRERRLPELVEASRHPRRPPHAHHGDRRPATLEEMAAEAAGSAATSISPSPIIRRRWPWRTGSTRSAWSRLRSGSGS